MDSFKEESRLRFFMIYDDNIFVGLSGIYCYKNDYDNAWLGFFGIKEEFRNKGYGKLALLLELNFLFVVLILSHLMFFLIQITILLFRIMVFLPFSLFILNPQN